MTGAYRASVSAASLARWGWNNRAAQAFDKREMGSNVGQYRVKGAPQMEDAPEPEYPPDVLDPAFVLSDAEQMEDLQEGDAADDDGEPFGGQ